MRLEFISKKPQDKFDVEIIFQNQVPEKTYVVSSILQMTAKNRKTGTDVSSSLFDSDISNFQGDSAFIWFNNYGNHNDIFDVLIVVETTTGQKLAQSIELSIDNDA